VEDTGRCAAGHRGYRIAAQTGLPSRQSTQIRVHPAGTRVGIPDMILHRAHRDQRGNIPPAARRAKTRVPRASERDSVSQAHHTLGNLAAAAPRGRMVMTHALRRMAETRFQSQVGAHIAMNLPARSCRVMRMNTTHLGQYWNQSGGPNAPTHRDNCHCIPTSYATLAWRKQKFWLCATSEVVKSALLQSRPVYSWNLS